MLVRFRVATGRIHLFHDGLIGAGELGAHRLQLFVAFNLDAEVVHAGVVATLRNGEVDPGVIQHPLGVVVLDYRRLGAEQTAVELDVMGEIVDRDVHVEAFHADFLFGVFTGSQAATQSSPAQQFSVRKPTSAFIAG